MNEIEKAIMDLQEYIGSGVYNGTNPPMYINTVTTAILALEKQLNNGWIPCSRELPEINKNVQVTFREYMKWSKKYRYGVCKAIYISQYSIKSENMGWNDCEDVEEYDETVDTYYVKSGWYEVIENWDDYTHVYINCEVTAWQPLPERYKEENHR